MDLGLHRRVAFVTGASKGIGRAAALSLAKEGCTVIAAARPSPELETVRDDLLGAGGSNHAVVELDVTDLDALVSVINNVAATHGKLDILVNNAGGPKPASLLETTRKDWEQSWLLCLMSVVEGCRAAIPHMRENSWGRIVSVTSVVAKEPAPSMALSATYRAGVNALTKALANDVIADGITVNAVLPSAVLTDRSRGLIQHSAEREGIAYDDMMKRTLDSLPAKRFATEKEIGNFVAYICSQHSGYLTGRSLTLDGGSSKSA